MDLMESILNDDIKKGDREISDGLWDLITRAVNKDPDFRSTASELKAHQWVNEGYQVNLNREGASMYANYTKQEILQMGLTPSMLNMAENIGKRFYQESHQNDNPQIRLKRKSSLLGN